MTNEAEGMKELESRLAKLVVMANDAVQSGDTTALLESAGEIASLKKQIESVQRAEKSRKLEQHQVEITKLLTTISARFDKAFTGSADDIKRLTEIGNEVDIVSYTVDVAANEKSFRAGPKGKTRVAGTGAGKSKRKVVLSDGREMDTKSFVLEFATEEEKLTKTFETWPTALAEKIAKREGATIS